MTREIKSLFGALLASVSFLASCASTPNIPIIEPSTDNNYRSYYEIFVGSFRDSDGDGMGDLKGVTEKIPYIKSLGFRGIWLMPIFASPSYHKYNISDYYKIDSAYGDENDLKELVKVAHENNIKVILDIALNHSSRSNVLFQKSVAAHAKKLGNLKAGDDKLLEGLSEEEIDSYSSLYSFYDTKEIADKSKMTYYQVPDHSFYYEGNFDSDMPEFNFDSSFAQSTFKDILQYWMDSSHGDVDGYRLDAVVYYYKGDAEKNYQALDNINTYVKNKKKDAYIVGEAWENSLAAINGYYKNTGIESYFYFPGQGAQGFLNLGLNPTVFANSDFLDGMVALESSADDKIPAPFIDNHDTNRFTRSKLTESKFLYGLFSTLSGNTFTYYGDEVGMQQNGNNDESKRTAMEWGEGNIAKDPANASPSNLLFGTVKDQLGKSDSLVNFVKKANAYRLAFPVITDGKIDRDVSKAGEEDYLLSIVKRKGDEKIKILYNFSQTKEASIQIDEGEKVVGDLVCGEGSVKTNGNKVILPSRSIAYVK